jgi:hypothetical protein
MDIVHLYLESLDFLEFHIAIFLVEINLLSSLSPREINYQFKRERSTNLN